PTNSEKEAVEHIYRQLINLYKACHHDKPYLFYSIKMTYKLHTHYKKILADTITPVSVYLKIMLYV
ncbi:hypothetical protein ACMUDG_19125, partial [Vibrio cholerae]|uniref:hypothetical protein n=1 Tax=Vibrio cholerae TaxID=666 RepID=UPI0039C91CF2